MCEDSDEGAEMMYRLATAFVQMQASQLDDENANKLRDLPKIIHKLACKALTISSKFGKSVGFVWF